MGWRFVLFYTYFREGKITDSAPDISRFLALYLSPELNMRTPVVVHLPVVLRQPFFELLIFVRGTTPKSEHQMPVARAIGILRISLD